MSEQQSVQTAMWVMVFVQTLGAVDMPGSGPRKMPSPRAYVPIIVAFFVLDIVADAGYGRAAKAMAWITVLAAMVLGPFGLKVVSFFNRVAGSVSSPPMNAAAAARDRAVQSDFTAPLTLTGVTK